LEQWSHRERHDKLSGKKRVGAPSNQLGTRRMSRKNIGVRGKKAGDIRRVDAAKEGRPKSSGPCRSRTGRPFKKKQRTVDIRD